MQKNTLVLIGIAFLAIAIGVVVFMSSKGSLQNTSSSAVANNMQSAVTIPFKEIVHGTKSTIDMRVNYLITSTDELKKLWKMVDATSTPPAIDFTTHVIMAVFAGQQPATGYAIAVSKIQDTAQRVVSITISRPDEACKQKRATTTPYALVQVPITSLPLTHEDIPTTIGCP